MALILRPQRKAFQLGWVRVLLRLAASGAGDLDQRLQGWAEDWQDQFLTPATGALPPSRLEEVRSLARDLGLLVEGRITDAGHVLLHADRDWQSDGDNPFQYTRAMRWLLWWLLGSSNDEFWSAAFRTWEPNQSTDEWILVAGRVLAEGHRPELLGLLEAITNPIRLREAHAKPRFGQLENLGWEAALPRLRAWATAKGSTWTAEDVLEAFVIAEGLDLRDPEPDRLRRVLAGLPPSLRGLLGDEAPSDAVQALAVADSLDNGGAECWFGVPWELTLDVLAPRGVRLKSGASSTSPNLTWQPGTLGDPWQPDEDCPADSTGSAASTDRTVQPSTQDDAAPLPPAPFDLTALDPRDQRAISWLRAVAWWCKGPTVGTVLVRGHDSLRLFISTLRHWLEPEQRKRWDRRRGPLKIAGRREVHVLTDTIESLVGVFEDPKLTWLVRELPHQGCGPLLAAVRRVDSAAVARPAADVARAWISDGSQSFDDVELATAVWLSELVESGRWSVEDLRDMVLDITERPAEGAAALISRLVEAPPATTWRFEGRLVVAGEPLELPEPQPGDVEFVPVQTDGAVRAQVVGYSVMGTGVHVRSAALEAQRRAVERLRDWAGRRGVSVHVVDSEHDIPEAYSEPDGEAVPVGVGPSHPADAGRPRWLVGEWFSPFNSAGRSTQALDRFRHARSEPDPARGLADLWFAIEHEIDDGDSGEPVIEALALASASLVPDELVTELRSALALGGTGIEVPDGWSNIRAWTPRIDCEWVRARWSRVQRLLDQGEDGTFHEAAVRAVLHLAWILKAVFAVRNRVVHDGWAGGGDDQIALRRLRQSAHCVVEALLDRRLEDGGSQDWQDLALFVTALEPRRDGQQRARRAQSGRASDSVDPVAFLTTWGRATRARDNPR